MQISTLPPPPLFKLCEWYSLYASCSQHDCKLLGIGHATLFKLHYDRSRTYTCGGREPSSWLSGPVALEPLSRAAQSLPDGMLQEVYTRRAAVANRARGWAGRPAIVVYFVVAGQVGTYSTVCRRSQALCPLSCSRQLL